jgi:hypothetical protein
LFFKEKRLFLKFPFLVHPIESLRLGEGFCFVSREDDYNRRLPEEPQGNLFYESACIRASDCLE